MEVYGRDMDKVGARRQIIKDVMASAAGDSNRQWAVYTNGCATGIERYCHPGNGLLCSRVVVAVLVAIMPDQAPNGHARTNRDLCDVVVILVAIHVVEFIVEYGIVRRRVVGNRINIDKGSARFVGSMGNLRRVDQGCTTCCAAGDAQYNRHADHALGRQRAGNGCRQDRSCHPSRVVSLIIVQAAGQCIDQDDVGRGHIALVEDGERKGYNAGTGDQRAIGDGGNGFDQGQVVAAHAEQIIFHFAVVRHPCTGQASNAAQAETRSYLLAKHRRRRHVEGQQHRLVAGITGNGLRCRFTASKVAVAIEIDKTGENGGATGRVDYGCRDDRGLAGDKGGQRNAIFVIAIGVIAIGAGGRLTVEFAVLACAQMQTIHDDVASAIAAQQRGVIRRSGGVAVGQVAKVILLPKVVAGVGRG